MTDQHEKDKAMLKRIQEELPAAVDHEKVAMIISWIMSCYDLSLPEVNMILLSVAKHQRFMHDLANPEDKKVH